MRSIVDTVILQDDYVRKATSAYIDDPYVNEDIALATSIVNHLSHFGHAKVRSNLKMGVSLLA